MDSSTPSELALQLLLTGAYSDLEVRCGAYSGKVHKAIMCTQSEWFANAVKEERFLEGETGVIKLHEDNSEAVRAMVQFLYTGDYTITHDDTKATAESETTSKADEILSHLDVYSVADMILLEKLKRCVESKISQIMKMSVLELVNDKQYLDIAKKTYDVSPAGEKGRHLRSTVVNLTATMAKTLFQIHADLQATIESIPAFGADLSYALAYLPPLALPEAHPPTPQFAVERDLRCGFCMDLVYVGAASGLPEQCPRGCASSVFATGVTRVRLSIHKNITPTDVYKCSAGHVFGQKRGQAAATECVNCDLVPQKLPSTA